MIVNKIKAKVYALMFWQTNLGDFFNKIYDLKIFYKYSFHEKKLIMKEHYQAYLTKQYHIVEKGMALPNTRKGFGKPKILSLIAKTNEYRNKFAEDRLVEDIKMTLLEYLKTNTDLEKDDKEYFNTINEFVKGTLIASTGGVKSMTKSEIMASVSIDFSQFLKSRSSVRNFSEEEVTFAEIMKVVDLARNAPSVCNRQSWRLHYYQDNDLMKELLTIQNGNNGFTESINKLLIVTTDVQKFTKLESNQVYVDGGLFAMNLLLSMHSLGIASCCLNTCFPYVVEKRVKKNGNIPESQRLIMMIGIGKFKEDFTVAVSNKIKVEEIVTLHN